MRSLRIWITVTMLWIIVAALATVTLLSAFFINKTKSSEADQLLWMLCDTKAKSLDYYFDSVEGSVEMVKNFAEEDIYGIDDESFSNHMEHMREYFALVAAQTNGVLTYYYRIDPSVSENEKGFWYIDLDGTGFEEHEVTDITQYDVEDTSKLVWFTVPKHEGKSIWLPPYITDNLDVKVISYDAPVYWNGIFVGVVGIELDYTTLAEEINSIHFYENGYAFLSDEDGYLFYHPYIDVSTLPEGPAAAPFSTSDESSLVTYEYDGVEKVVAWKPLSNGMQLNITVPVEETQGDWKGLIANIITGAVLVIIVASLLIMFYTRRITKPLEQLTEAADQVEKGNYDFVLTYDKNDELGRLTKAFNHLAANVNAHINDLNEQVLIDAFTHVKNKGAYTKALDELQRQKDECTLNPELAIGMFDCDNLKLINDRYGHDKGDEYLKAACRTISDVFKHSPVFRVGGDEFAVILQNEDFKYLDWLIEQFAIVASDNNRIAEHPWNEVQVSSGFAVYDPEVDGSIGELAQRADKLMYENKRVRKGLA